MNHASISVQPYGNRQSLVVRFNCVPPDYVITKLRDLADAYPAETVVKQGKDSLSVVMFADHVRKRRFALIKMALHRTGFCRYDEVFLCQEDADLCFATDVPVTNQIVQADAA